MMLVLENEKEISDTMDYAIASAHKTAAIAYLESIRKALKDYNLSRHIITISAGMGACNLLVDGLYFETYRLKDSRLNILHEIEEFLDWDWCAYLNGAIINQPSAEMLAWWNTKKQNGELFNLYGE